MNSLEHRQGLLLGALVILAMISIPVMRYLLQWDVGVVASVWVAIGTLALAGATWWNVSQTKAVVAGEDRRHQQSFVPIVEVMWCDFSDATSGNVSIHSRNIGKGPALDIRATFKGSMTVSFGILGSAEDENHNYRFDTLVFEKSASTPDTSSDGIVALTAKDFNLTRYARANPAHNTLAITSAEIAYVDLFGNPYKTIYDDFSARRYHLEQPSYLKLPAR